MQEIKDLVLAAGACGSPGADEASPRGPPEALEARGAAAASTDPRGSAEGRSHAPAGGLRGSPGGTEADCAETQLAAAPDLCTLSHWLDEGLPEHLFFELFSADVLGEELGRQNDEEAMGQDVEGLRGNISVYLL